MRLFSGLRRLKRGACLLALLAGLAAAESGPERMQRLAGERYGSAGTRAVADWRELLVSTAGLPDEAKLQRVNDFFNRRVRFGDDTEIWGKADYWATPLETLGRSAGDCEDFTIAKYATLRLAGVAPERLRLTYVKARIGRPGSHIVQAHMVLSYYPTPEAEPLVLDNLIAEILPASRRPDLTTVFGFDAAGLWVRGAPPRVAGSAKLSKWQSVLMRMQAEGIDQ